MGTETRCPYHPIAADARRVFTEGASTLRSIRTPSNNWHKLKPERNTILAVLLRSVGDKLSQERQRNPFSGYAPNEKSLFQGIPAGDLFFPHACYMDDLFSEVVDRCFDSWREIYTNDVYTRYSEIFRTRYDDPDNRLTAALEERKKFFSGIGTALIVMNGYLGAVPQLYAASFPKKERSKRGWMRLAHAGEPPISRLAAMHLGAFCKIQGKLMMNRNLHECYKATEDEEGNLSVALSDDLERDIEEAYKENYEDERTGCPATVNFGRSASLRAVMKQVWRWYLEDAPAIYESALAEAA